MGYLPEFTVNLLASAAWSAITNMRTRLVAESVLAERREEDLDAFNFRHARLILKQQRKALALLAANFPPYRDSLLVGPHVPLLCEGSWIPERPVPLPAPDEAMKDDSSALATRLIDRGAYPAFIDRAPQSVVNASRAIMPVQPGSGGTRNADYVTAIETIRGERPGAWADRPSYRLLNVCREGASHILEFVPSHYFEFQRTCEVFCYEMALRIWMDGGQRYHASCGEKEIRALWSGLEVRKAAGPWNNFSGRHAVAGINNLTILRSGDRCRFLMMKRGTGAASLQARSDQKRTRGEPGAVASAMGAIHVLPAGEFQPSTSSPARFREECTIWCTLMREFAEEILLMKEAKAQDVRVFDFGATSPFSLMVDAARANPPRWRTFYLGTAVDPLSLKPEILTVTILEAAELRRMYEILYRSNAYTEDAFAKEQVERILRDEQIVPASNSEGAIFAFNVGGEILTADTLAAFVTDETTLPAAMGCLSLTLRHLEELVKT